jgi:hypothetical protein
MDNKAIIKRGYATSEEYAEMAESGKLEKLNLESGDGFSEGIWIFPLETNRVGQDFHFVFHNDPIAGLGSPRAIAGLVGIAKSRGTHTRGVAQYSDCIELFKKAGQPAIDYFWESYEKETGKKRPSVICN